MPRSYGTAYSHRFVQEAELCVGILLELEHHLKSVYLVTMSVELMNYAKSQTLAQQTFMQMPPRSAIRFSSRTHIADTHCGIVTFVGSFLARDLYTNADDEFGAWSVRDRQKKL